MPVQIYQVEKDRTFTRWKEQMARLRMRRSMHKDNAAASRGAVLGQLPTFNRARGDRSRAPPGTMTNPGPIEVAPPKRKGLFSWLGGSTKAAGSATKGDATSAARPGPDGKVAKPDAEAGAPPQGAAVSPNSPVKPDFKDQVTMRFCSTLARALPVLWVVIPDVIMQVTSFLEEVKQKTRKAEIEAEVLAKAADKKPELHAKYHIQVHQPSEEHAFVLCLMTGQILGLHIQLTCHHLWSRSACIAANVFDSK